MNYSDHQGTPPNPSPTLGSSSLRWFPLLPNHYQPLPLGLPEICNNPAKPLLEGYLISSAPISFRGISPPPPPWVRPWCFWRSARKRCARPSPSASWRTGRRSTGRTLPSASALFPRLRGRGGGGETKSTGVEPELKPTENQRPKEKDEYGAA